MWKCPECKEEITYLSYEAGVSAYEYGSAYLTKNPTENTLETRRRHEIIADFDCSETDNGGDWSEDPSFRCPECDSNLELDDLTWIFPPKKSKKTKEPEEPEEPEETLHNIIKPKQTIIKEQPQKNISSILCKKCKHLIIANSIDHYESINNTELFICPKCETQNSIDEFQKLLNNNFFNKIIPKHATRKKIKSKPVTTLGKPKQPIHT